MNTRVVVAAGVLLIGASFAWRTSPVGRWTQRLPPGWEWRAEQGPASALGLGVVLVLLGVFHHRRKRDMGRPAAA